MILIKRFPFKFFTFFLFMSFTVLFVKGQGPKNISEITTSSSTDVGKPASDVGVPASNVGVAASDVGVPATDVGVAETKALPPSYTDDEMTFHVAGKTSKMNGSDISITFPISTTTWIANATNLVSWTGANPERLSIQLINDDTSRLESGLSLRASVETKDGQATVLLPNVKDGNGYYIRLYDQLDVSKTLATSDKFQIVRQTSAPFQNPAGLDIAANTTITNKPGQSGTQSEATGTAKNSTNAGVLPSSQNDAYRMHSISYLFLVIIVLMISISVLF